MLLVFAVAGTAEDGAYAPQAGVEVTAMERAAVHQRHADFWRRISLPLVLLVALVVHVWRAWSESAVWPDVIRYIEQGQRLVRDPLGGVRSEAYHPLHSLLTWVSYTTVTRHVVGEERLAWIAAAQVVGVVSAVFVVWAVILLSRHFGAPWWAACAAGVLWAVGRRTSGYGADGLSDMLFLALFAWAILLGMRTRLHARLGLWFLSGVLAGLAYLTRPEGAGAIILLGFALIYHHRKVFGFDGKQEEERGIRGRGFNACVVSMLMLAVGFGIPAAPYMVAIGKFTGKKNLFEPEQSAQVSVVVRMQPVEAGVVPGVFTDGSIWLKIGREIFETFGFAPCIIVGLAILFTPRPWGRRHWRALVFFWIVFWMAVMVWLIQKTRAGDPLHHGYLDGRHTLVLQLVLFPLFALALPLWRRPMVWYQNMWRRLKVWPRLPAWMRSGRWPNITVMIVFILGILPGVICLSAPSEADRQYIRDGAAWIASHTGDDTVVYDAERVVGYYSGRRYGVWIGNPEMPRVSKLPVGAPVILAYVYRDNAKIAEAIGGYVALKTFKSVGATHGDVLVLYARPGSHVVTR